MLQFGYKAALFGFEEKPAGIKDRQGVKLACALEKVGNAVGVQGNWQKVLPLTQRNLLAAGGIHFLKALEGHKRVRTNINLQLWLS
jgi:hypothetical protein